VSTTASGHSQKLDRRVSVEYVVRDMYANIDTSFAGTTLCLEVKLGVTIAWGK
jgi:PBP1b-binding outer membrane lipoprotein LpoB